MAGMKIVGDLFGEGRCSCPGGQECLWIKSGGLPDAVYGAGKGSRAATADARRSFWPPSGDVHDIGKNIVGIVLACNNYRIIDSA